MLTIIFLHLSKIKNIDLKITAIFTVTLGHTEKIDSLDAYNLKLFPNRLHYIYSAHWHTNIKQ